MRKAIVTGGNGFVASALIRRLRGLDVEVHAIVNEFHDLADTLPASCIHPTLGNPAVASEIVTALQADTIFHLAAVYREPTCFDSVASMLSGNVALGAGVLLAAARQERTPVFVNAGSYWQFAAVRTYQPNSFYAATKQAFQDILQYFTSKLGMRGTTLVLYDTFGPGDQRGKLWSRLVDAEPGTSFPLTSGHQTIHLTHVEDVVDAFLHAADLLHAGRAIEPTYFLPSLTPTTLRQLVEALNTEAALDLHLQWDAVPYWEGQVFEPYVGEPLPGWAPQRNVLLSLVEMAGQKCS